MMAIIPIVAKAIATPSRIAEIYITVENKPKIKIIINAGEKTNFSAAVVNGSHDQYFAGRFIKFIEQFMEIRQPMQEYAEKYNYDNENTYLIHFTFFKIYKESILQYESTFEAMQKRTEELYNKIHDIILQAKTISHSAIIHKTRFITTIERENILSQLMTDNKIKMEIKTSFKKPQKVYYAI